MRVEVPRTRWIELLGGAALPYVHWLIVPQTGSLAVHALDSVPPGEQVCRHEVNAMVMQVVFTPNGSLMAVSDCEGGVKLFEACEHTVRPNHRMPDVLDTISRG